MPARRPAMSGMLLGLLGVGLLLVLGLYAVFAYRSAHLENLLQEQGNVFKGELDRVARGIEELQMQRVEAEKQAETRRTVDRELVSRLETSLKRIQDHLARPEERPAKETASSPRAGTQKQEMIPPLPEVSEKQSFDFWTYQATEDDTLWDIARQHLKDGKYYPLLLEFNPDLEIYDIGRGVSLRIPREISDIQELYESIIERRNGRLFWNYTAAPGDTLKSIARKFYGSVEHVSKVTALNPGLELKSGTAVKIELY